MLRDPAMPPIFAQGIVRSIERYLTSQQSAGIAPDTTRTGGHD